MRLKTNHISMMNSMDLKFIKKHQCQENKVFQELQRKVR